MEINIFEFVPGVIRVHTEKKFLDALLKWLTPYVKREIKKASLQYECVTYREAFDQVLAKESGDRFERFQIYQEIIDLGPGWDLANIDEFN